MKLGFCIAGGLCGCLIGVVLNHIATLSAKTQGRLLLFIPQAGGNLQYPRLGPHALSRLWSSNRAALYARFFSALGAGLEPEATDIREAAGVKRAMVAAGERALPGTRPVLV